MFIESYPGHDNLRHDQPAGSSLTDPGWFMTPTKTCTYETFMIP